MIIGVDTQSGLYNKNTFSALTTQLKCQPLGPDEIECLFVHSNHSLQALVVSVPKWLFPAAAHIQSSYYQGKGVTTCELVILSSVSFALL
jgi:hypothetical protein